MNMIAAIQNLDSKEVRHLLDSLDFDIDQDETHNFVEEVILTAKDKPEMGHKRSEIIFMLCNAGFYVNKINQNNVSPLYLAAKFNDVNSCHALLQCGGDMHHLISGGMSIIDEVLYSDDYSEEIQSVFDQFKPGLWEAVRTCDVNLTRKLVNLWCRTDIKKNDKELKTLALDSGVEGIIGLILNVEPTMKLVHHILSKDIRGAHHLLDTIPQHINFNFRNLNENGAPILFYAIENQMVSVICKMRQYDCRLYTVMRDDSGFDMPLFFTSLTPEISTEVIESLLQGKDTDKVLYRILYLGKSVLEKAIDGDVSEETFRVLLTFGGPRIVASRNQSDETPRDYAIRVGKFTYVSTIDQIVESWLKNHKEHCGKREVLALHGYDSFPDLESTTDEFLHILPSYQNQIRELCLSAENGDVESFRTLMCYELEKCELFLKQLFWEARAVGEGLPILHRAVIWNQEEIVKTILLSKSQDQSIDNLLDQFHRTALHYAFAIKGKSAIVPLLMDQGCSEHTLDKNGREPIDFKQKRYTQEMKDLLDRLKMKDFKSLEPEPWNVQCPILPELKSFYPTRFYHSHNQKFLNYSSNFEADESEEDSVKASTCEIL